MTTGDFIWENWKIPSLTDLIIRLDSSRASERTANALPSLAFLIHLENHIWSVEKQEQMSLDANDIQQRGVCPTLSSPSSSSEQHFHDETEKKNDWIILIGFTKVIPRQQTSPLRRVNTDKRHLCKWNSIRCSSFSWSAENFPGCLTC